ncbi:MAG: response regulator [Lachnospiraceae bacterium]|nr:response regulator [Lachnospiraceae bacterium]
MIRIMIVDDMPIFLDYLRNCIDWNSYGFEICCEAHDGKEALEKLDEFYPDVVLTDITMPYLNGLELAETITRDYPEISIILITGNNEFEYARKAVKIGVCDYIVKPFEKEELILSLLKLQDNIDKAVENETGDKDLAASEDLRALIYAGTVKDRLFEKQKESGGFLVSLVKFDVANKERTGFNTIEDLMNWETLIAKLLRGKLEIDGEFKIFHDFENNIVIIMNFNNGREADNYKGYEFTDIIGVIKSQLSIECSIAMAKADAITGVKDAYRKALTYLGEKPYGSFYDIRNNEDKGNYASLNDIYRLNSDIEALKLQDAIDAINSMDTDRGGMNLLSSAVSVLMTNVINSGFPIERIFGAGFNIENLFDKAGSIEEAKEKVIELYRKRIEFESGCEHSSHNKASDVATAVKKYIDLNYSNCEMSMNDISSEIGVNQTYLRKMFKSEIGMTLTEYITKIRLEKAKSIITETGASLQEVSDAVGFSDVSYFSKVFKKYYGYSPSHIKMK